MGKHAQIERSRKVVSVFVAISGRGSSKPPIVGEWQADLLTSWLFQTCIKLQTSLDRRFRKFGMTVQEANVLLRCVEARRITPGQLAIALGRDKGKITRLADRLELSRLVTRDIGRRDRRFSILKPTAKGKHLARDLASVFDSIHGMKTEGPQISQSQIAAGILTPSPSGRAANTVPIEQEGDESEVIRNEQSNEENNTRGMLVDEHVALVLK